MYDFEIKIWLNEVSIWRSNKIENRKIRNTLNYNL